MSKSKKPVVFLSYARTDFDRVSDLYTKLESQGFEVWMDRMDIRSGDWLEAIKRALRRSNFFLACFSRNSETAGDIRDFEIDYAVQVQKDHLEGPGYLIPVRLERCEPPAKLKHFQWIDLYEPDGFKRLLKALGRRPAVLPRWAAAGLLTLAAFVFGLWWGPFRSAASTFVSFRQGGKSYMGLTRQMMVGVTVWKLRPVQTSDPPGARYLIHPPASPTEPATTYSYTPVRLNPADLHLKDSIFLSVECSRKGYLYVADREARSDGSTGAPLLIFPTARLNGADNTIEVGHPLEIPDRFSRPNYLEVNGESNYAGERLTVVITPGPLALTLSNEATWVPEHVVQEWERQWGRNVKEAPWDRSESIGSDREAMALNGRVPLGSADPPPQLIYSAPRTAGESIAVSISLKLGH